MKVTFVMASGFSMAGGDRVVASYADQLKRRGHEVFVVSRPLPWPSMRERMRSLYRGQGWVPYQRHVRSHFDGVDVPRKLLRTFRPVTDRDVPDADVVIATWWETAQWVHDLSARKGRKFYFVQGHETFDALRVEAVRASYRLPLHKIVVSKWLAGIMANDYGDHATSYVPNTVDPSCFHAAPREKNEVPTVGMMYSAERLKGCDIGLAAIALAKKQIPGLRVVVLSNHPESADLPLPTGAEFFLAPPQAQLKDIYAKCDAWLFPSRAEGFGLPIVEAMACRTPVIAAPAGAAPELLEGGSGMLVRAEDPDDMARAIVEMCQQSPEAWRTLSDRAYEKSTRYSLGNAVDALELAIRAR